MSWFGKRRIYLDYASATPPLPEALSVFEEVSAKFGNPGAIHAEGVAARAALDAARAKIALGLGVKAREVVFTSGATEANNLAILGRARQISIRSDLTEKDLTETQGRTLRKTHWVVSAIEHPSVLECFVEVERFGGKVSFVDPDEKGIINAAAVSRVLKPETVFVSVGWANHEIGTIQPLREIARAIRTHEEKCGTHIIFHSDAGQAPLYISPQVHTLGADVMTFDAGKLYALRGIGLLVGKRYCGQEGELLAPIILGGGQEYGVRAGTENVALASAFAESFAIISSERDEEARRVRELRDELAARLRQGFGGQANSSIVINGDLKYALPHMLNVSIPNVQSEYLTLQLDNAGIAVSTKSACKEGEQFSHVVLALENASLRQGSGMAREERARNTIRFSLGRDTNGRDIQRVLYMCEKLVGG